MKSRGSIFSTFATSVERRLGDLPPYGLSDTRVIAGITALRPATAISTAALPTAYDCSDVGLRREMARRALQVVGHRPVILVLELVLDERRDQRADAAELRVAERIARARFRHELAVARPAGLRDTPMQQ